MRYLKTLVTMECRACGKRFSTGLYVDEKGATQVDYSIVNCPHCGEKLPVKPADLDSEIRRPPRRPPSETLTGM